MRIICSWLVVGRNFCRFPYSSTDAVGFQQVRAIFLKKLSADDFPNDQGSFAGFVSPLAGEDGPAPPQRFKLLSPMRLPGNLAGLLPSNTRPELTVVQVVSPARTDNSWIAADILLSRCPIRQGFWPISSIDQGQRVLEWVRGFFCQKSRALPKSGIAGRYRSLY